MFRCCSGLLRRVRRSFVARPLPVAFLLVVSVVVGSVVAVGPFGAAPAHASPPSIAASPPPPTSSPSGNTNRSNALDADDAWRVFARSNSSFLSIKRLGGGGFDWSDNGCSVPWVLRMSVPALDFVARTFAAECAQHDFAYRNFGGLHRLDASAARRTSVDRHFYTLMRVRCRAADMVRRHRVFLCRFYAHAFYAAVRAFGHF